MINSIKFAKLDAFTMKPFFSMFWTLIFVECMFLFMGPPGIVIYFTCAWIVPMIASNIFVKEEKNNLKRLYGTLSVSLRDIVLGRYIFVSLYFLVAILLTFFLSYAATLLRGNVFNLQDNIIGITTSFLLFSVMSGGQIPILFKMGYDKGRYLAMIPFFPLLLPVLMLVPKYSGVFYSVINFVMLNQGIFAVLGIIIGFCILFTSYNASLFLYKIK